MVTCSGCSFLRGLIFERKPMGLSVWIDRLRQVFRIARGEDAYERYLAHRQECHGREPGPPLSRKAFFRQELERKWGGVKRCC